MPFRLLESSWKTQSPKGTHACTFKKILEITLFNKNAWMVGPGEAFHGPGMLENEER